MSDRNPNPPQAQVFSAILGVLKTVLRERGLTYKDLAQRMGLTEGALKKTFAADDMSFSRMIELCDAAEVSYFELVRRADDQKEKRITLNAKQEAFFASDLRTWRFFMDLLEMPLEQVRKKHDLSSERVEHYLENLSRLELIERKGPYGYTFRFEGRLVAWNPQGEFARLHNRRIATHLLRKSSILPVWRTRVVLS